jgi:hypothetical protein
MSQDTPIGGEQPRDHDHDHHDHDHHDHDHDHDHDHAHGGHDHGHASASLSLVVEDEAGNLEGQQLIDALQALLARKGIISNGEVTLEIQNLESPGTHLGAKIVARAWADPAFKERLLQNGKNGAAELGIKVGEAQLVVVENTPQAHNLIVCTLCSCYPRSILGQPPSWYLSKAYRARGVREPAKVLEEFGLFLPPGTAIHVHDSNADMRFLVLPMRPAGSEGFDEDSLRTLVTRDSMIGVAQPLEPASTAGL